MEHSQLSPPKNHKLTEDIKVYKNKKENKCVNEIEIINRIDEGAVWKVYHVLRYYYDEDKQIKTKQYALKRTHIMTQYKRRYFKNEKMITYLDEVFNEISILDTLNDNSEENSKFVIKLHEVLYNAEFPYLYLVTDFCDLGPIMQRDHINYNHFHSDKIIKFFMQRFGSKIELQYDELDRDNTLIKKLSLPLSFKHTISKKIFKDLLLGIKYIHSKNISHRDIKIENLLYDSINDKATIIDFSISSHLPSNKMINEPGGSLHYQSPEMFSTESTKGYYNPLPGDIYSLGVCMYIFIYEEFPYDDECELALQMKILKRELKFPFDSQDKDYDEVLAAMMEKDPQKRESIDEILTYKYFN